MGKGASSKGVHPQSKEHTRYMMHGKGGEIRTVKPPFFVIKGTVLASFN